ncbi:MAG: hypothetical protein HYU02_08835 [Thaumarchaeota archaeon]|nr:hypothetical protein [Nitrososphaerota archaeon]
MCNTALGSKEELLAHVEKYHRRETSVFTCDTCGATFRLEAELMDHLKTSHPGRVSRATVSL